MSKKQTKKLIGGLGVRLGKIYLRYMRSRKVALGIVALIVVFACTCTFGAMGISSYYGIRTGFDTFKVTPSKGVNVTYNNHIDKITEEDLAADDCLAKISYTASQMNKKVNFALPSVDDQTITPMFGPDTNKNAGVGIDAIENGLSWTQLELLDIFSNPEFGGEKIIAPGTTGSYYFTVKNTADFAMKCALRFEDINDPESRVPMLYRLRSEDGYLLGDDTTWLTLEEIINFDIPLNIDKSKDFILDWKWIYEDLTDIETRDELDTMLGNKAYDLWQAGKKLEYKLKLIILADQVEFPNDPSPITGEMTAYIAAGGILTFVSGFAIIAFAKKRKKKEEE